MGEDYYDKIKHITPDTFQQEFKIIMDLYDLALGSRYENMEPPKPGLAHYRYSENTYPFEDGSSSENAVWAFSQGTASKMHGKKMDADITRRGGFVEICSDTV